jgi:hypothetical protein
MGVGKCPKCGASIPVPSCPNCANNSLQPKKLLGNFYLECARCDKSYSHVACPKCDCQIPAKAFVGFVWPGFLATLGLLTVVVLVLALAHC